MLNFDKSLPRKRDFALTTQVERQINETHGSKRFNFSKVELKELISNYTLQQIANIHQKRFGISIHHTTVSYWRNKWL
jgi:hypothetical protein